MANSTFHLSACFALSADARITTGQHASSGFGSPRDHQRLLELRALADAVLVGRKTLEADQMRLNLASAPQLQQARQQRNQPPNPTRIIASASGNIDFSHPVFNAEGGPIHILSTQKPPTQLPPAIHWHTHEDILTALDDLSLNHQLHHIHCEGGATLMRTFCETNRLDTLHLTLTAKLFGGYSAPGILGPPGPFLPKTLNLKLTHMQQHGDECFLTYQRPTPS